MHIILCISVKCTIVHIFEILCIFRSARSAGDVYARRALCVTGQCKGLQGRDFKVCTRALCASDTRDPNSISSGSVNAECAHYCDHFVGVMRSICAYRCRGTTYSSDRMVYYGSKGGKLTEPIPRKFEHIERALGRWINDRENNEKHLYNDDTSRARQMNDVEGYVHLDNPDVNVESERHLIDEACKVGCREKSRRGLEKYEACLIENCEIRRSLDHPVSKRWSTRMCMESHCKAANNKVQYFLCGKQHCHK